MVIKIFIWGAIITFPVFMIEFGIAQSIGKISLPPIYISILYWFVAIALVEEIFKYLVVKGKALKSYAMDEPVDIMIYMVIAALGFAALENILYLLPPAEKIFSLNEILTRTVLISFFRFIGATFLHALCSGLVGYFSAISICKGKKGRGLVLLGLLIAIFLHGLYNLSIMEIGMPLKYILPVAILIGLSIFITFAFRHLKTMKSVCKITKKDYGTIKKDKSKRGL